MCVLTKALLRLHNDDILTHIQLSYPFESKSITLLNTFSSKREEKHSELSLVMWTEIWLIFGLTCKRKPGSLGSTVTHTCRYFGPGRRSLNQVWQVKKRQVQLLKHTWERRDECVWVWEREALIQEWALKEFFGVCFITTKTSLSLCTRALWQTGWAGFILICTGLCGRFF